jgi:bla regulator protein BlaR1
MTIYLAKFVLSSGLFLFAYLLLLDKEKAHKFKRLYLLASLSLSLIIPLISIESKTAIIPVQTIQHFAITPLDPPAHVNAVVAVQEYTDFVPYLIFGIYASITTLLLLRFGRNLYILLSNIKQSEKTSWQDTTIVLSKKNIAPYSFINYIFVSKVDYEDGQIAEEILQHELAHIQQKHSIDVIAIELLQIFLWFNPLLYFYRKAIQTNHEYLADEAVVNIYQDISTYQLILIQYISVQSGLSLTSQFNYLTIKKRLIMMSKADSIKKVIAKQLVLVPILGLAVALFATKTVAQNNPKQVTAKQIASTKESISTAELAEFNSILAKYDLQKKPEHDVTFPVKLDKAENDRLLVLYNKMSLQQRKTLDAKIVYIEPAKANTPSKIQLVEWQNSKKYGVWIDDKRVDNAALANYQATDFSQWDSSRLTEKAINYGKHYFQVNLMTKAYYKSYYAEASKNKPVMVRFLKHD